MRHTVVSEQTLFAPFQNFSCFWHLKWQFSFKIHYLNWSHNNISSKTSHFSRFCSQLRTRSMFDLHNDQTATLEPLFTCTASGLLSKTSWNLLRTANFKRSAVNKIAKQIILLCLPFFAGFVGPLWRSCSIDCCFHCCYLCYLLLANTRNAWQTNGLFWRTNAKPWRELTILGMDRVKLTLFTSVGN